MTKESEYPNGIIGDSNIKIRDIEDKQRILKDRIILIGKNFIENKERNDSAIIEIKKDVDNIKSEINKISSFIEDISQEISKFAKKEDLEILTKQAKMFQPLNFIRRDELEKLKKEQKNK
jgi:hypothetical protein